MPRQGLGICCCKPDTRQFPADDDTNNNNTCSASSSAQIMQAVEIYRTSVPRCSRKGVCPMISAISRSHTATCVFSSRFPAPPLIRPVPSTTHHLRHHQPHLPSPQPPILNPSSPDISRARGSCTSVIASEDGQATTRPAGPCHLTLACHGCPSRLRRLLPW